MKRIAIVAACIAVTLVFVRAYTSGEYKTECLQMMDGECIKKRIIR